MASGHGPIRALRLLALLGGAAAGCGGLPDAGARLDPGAPAKAGAPLAWPGAAWRRLPDAERDRLDPERLREIRARAEALDSVALMVVARGLVVLAWGEIDRKVELGRMGESLLGALVGLEVVAGRLDLEASLADLGLDDEPGPLLPKERRARVRDLLSARSGVYHDGARQDRARARFRPRRGSYDPGSYFFHQAWDVNVLASLVCRGGTGPGEGLGPLFARRVARPVQMEDFLPGDAEPLAGPESRHPNWRFRMSARDLARFGLLYGRGGMWRDRQVLPQAWVRASTRTQVEGATPIRGYGYLWWTYARAPGVFAAEDPRGKRLWVDPAGDLVIVHLAEPGPFRASRVDRDVQALYPAIRGLLESAHRAAPPAGG